MILIFKENLKKIHLIFIKSQSKGTKTDSNWKFKMEEQKEIKQEVNDSDTATKSRVCIIATSITKSSKNYFPTNLYSSC